jgi:hypothetical protein
MGKFWNKIVKQFPSCWKHIEILASHLQHSSKPNYVMLQPCAWIHWRQVIKSWEHGNSKSKWCFVFKSRLYSWTNDSCAAVIATCNYQYYIPWMVLLGSHKCLVCELPLVVGAHKPPSQSSSTSHEIEAASWQVIYLSDIHWMDQKILQTATTWLLLPGL